jgi:hypothetical protein
VKLIIFAVFFLPLPMSEVKNAPEYNLFRTIAYDSEYVYHERWQPGNMFFVRRLSDGVLVDSVLIDTSSSYSINLSGFATDGSTKVFSFEGNYFHEPYTVIAVKNGKVIYRGQPFPGKENMGSVFYSARQNAFVATSTFDYGESDSVTFRVFSPDFRIVTSSVYHVSSTHDYHLMPYYYYECDDHLYGMNYNDICEVKLDSTDDSLRLDSIQMEGGDYEFGGRIVYRDFDKHRLFSFSCDGIKEKKFPGALQAFNMKYNDNTDLHGNAVTFFPQFKSWQSENSFYQEDFNRKDTLPDDMVFLPSGVLEIYEVEDGSFSKPGWYSECRLVDENGKEKFHFGYRSWQEEVFLEHQDTLSLFDIGYRHRADFSMKDGHRIDFPGVIEIFEWRFKSNRDSHFFFIWLSLLLWPLILIEKRFHKRKTGEIRELQASAWLYALLALPVLTSMIFNLWF